MAHSNWNSCIDFERNEIVFENRNKLFGAYVIRRDYPRNVLLSFMTSCLFMSTLLLTPFLINSFQNHPAVITGKMSEVINLEQFNPPPVEITPPSITPPASVSPITSEITNPIVVDNRLATPDIQMASGIASTPSLPSNGGEVISTMGSGVAVPVIPENIPENPVTKWAEIMPKFQGGDDKLMTYLSSHIRYPSKALSIGIEGTVYVSFIVDTTGLITNVQLIRGIYEACDLEAVKAVSNMPRWIPGSQNGNKVRVEMSLPVRFILK